MKTVIFLLALVMAQAQFEVATVKPCTIEPGADARSPHREVEAGMRSPSIPHSDCVQQLCGRSELPFEWLSNRAWSGLD